MSLLTPVKEKEVSKVHYKKYISSEDKPAEGTTPTEPQKPVESTTN